MSGDLGPIHVPFRNYVDDVTKIRGWPMVGRNYWVPAIWIPDAWIPVHPASHLDNSASFPHHHVDVRFVDPEMEQAFAEQKGALIDLMATDVRHLFDNSDLPLGLRVAMHFAIGVGSDGVGKTRPTRQIMTCHRSTVQWDMRQRDTANSGRYFLPEVKTSAAVIAEEGRPLCPHHNFDLSCVWDGKSETVRCPLHGLIVKCR